MYAETGDGLVHYQSSGSLTFIGHWCMIGGGGKGVFRMIMASQRNESRLEMSQMRILYPVRKLARYDRTKY